MLSSVKNILFLVAMPALLMAQDNISRIAFGSCSFQFGKQKIWKSVVEQDPQLWVWLGDIIYADTKDMEKMAAKYAQLDANPNYNLIKQKCPIIATWDDHDCGENNCGKDYPKMTESQKLFLDFFKAEESDPRRSRRGVYTSYVYGQGDQKVKVILLDLRCHREHPGQDSDMLGAEQWEWLEQELRNSDATINIIGSSIQFVSTIRKFENWDKFPSSQNRILKLIGETGTKGVVFISGDVHYAETSKRKYDQVSYPIYDLTSSGLTHGNQVQGFNNPYRVGDSRFGFRNFGFIEFDWNAKQLIFKEFNRKGEVQFSHPIPFSEIGY